VGSDPYLAPEVYDNKKYDPRAVDVWSLAIIFCCMSLRRFPWKAPRLTDTSYKLFVAPPTPGQPTVDNARGTSDSAPIVGRVRERSDDAVADLPRHLPHSDRSNHNDQHLRQDTAGETVDGSSDTTHSAQPVQPHQQPTIKGPWRLLRLLPRETRYIIGRMLDTDPGTRATLPEMHADKWISTSPFCRQAEGGEIIRAEGHKHVLEPSATSGAPTRK